MSSNSPLKSSTCHNFQASRMVELNRSIWPIRERSVCSAPDDARGLLYLFQAEQRTTRTRSLRLKETNPGVVHLCLHITLAALPLLTPSPPGILHVSMSSLLSFTSTALPPLPLNFHTPLPPQTAHLFLLNQ